MFITRKRYEEQINKAIEAALEKEHEKQHRSEDFNYLSERISNNFRDLDNRLAKVEYMVFQKEVNLKDCKCNEAVPVLVR